METQIIFHQQEKRKKQNKEIFFFFSVIIAFLVIVNASIKSEFAEDFFGLFFTGMLVVCIGVYQNLESIFERRITLIPILISIIMIYLFLF